MSVLFLVVVVSITHHEVVRGSVGEGARTHRALALPAILKSVFSFRGLVWGAFGSARS